MDGVVRTTVGYTGGVLPEPTYRGMGDHSEAIRIEYDPAVVTYEQLLDVFWSSHRPRSSSRQYRSAIFVHDAEQRRAAAASHAERGGEHTAIEDAGTFTAAEDYHQKYYLRGSGVLREFEAMYPDDPGLVHSTAAARVNGMLGGHAVSGVERFGLSKKAQQALLGS